MTNKAYKFINLETPSPHIIVESTNVKCFENIFVFKKASAIVGAEFSNSMKKSKPIEATLTLSQRSIRKRKEKDFGSDFFVFCAEGDLLSYNEAMRSHDAMLWNEAIDDKMHSIILNNTWVLLNLPQ